MSDTPGIGVPNGPPPPPPPVFRQPGSAATQLEQAAQLRADRPLHPLTVPIREWVQETIWAAAVGRPRSRQAAIGFSEYGQVCERRLAYAAGEFPKVNTPDPWRADVGTAVHAHLAGVLARLNAGSGRFVIEAPVEYRGVIGTADLYDRRRRMVLDWKTTTSHSRKMRQAGGPTYQELLQVAGYARGIEARGEVVATLAIIVLPVDLELTDIRAWVTTFDDDLRAQVDTAIDRLEAIRGLEPAVAHPTPTSLCGWCPWHQSTARDPHNACQGQNGATP